MDSPPAISIAHLSHSYGTRKAIDDLSLDIASGELFAMLGPNGSGKTTLFRILSTLIPPAESASVRIFGNDVVKARDAVRREIAVVFQSPSLDKQLSAAENLRHHGHLYGLRGATLSSRVDEALVSAGLIDRAGERVGTFSGGMRRRVELAKGLLTRPKLLLLDEPSTGLDPAARIDLWATLERVRREMGVTIALTTHLMDEADRCDRLAIIARGRLLTVGSPDDLKKRFTGGDVVTIQSNDVASAKLLLRNVLSIEATEIEGTLRFEHADAGKMIARIVEVLPTGSIQSITFGRPTLEDVFVRVAGARFAVEDVHVSN